MASDPLICVHVSELCPIELTTYGYRPNLGGNCFLAAAFGIAFFANIFLGVRFRIRAYAIVVSLGCLSQVLGYIGRVGMYFRPFDAIPFQAQICCLIIGPAFNSAAIYLMLKHIVALFGPQWSILKPKLYTIIFVTADLVSLVLQAVGGGMTATADFKDKDRINMGNNIMMAGIAFQVVTLSIFAILSTLFCVRRLRALTTSPLEGNSLLAWHSLAFRCFIGGVVTAFLAIYIRCVYRIAEMRGGWGNKLMREEIPFIIFESV
ncbi:phospholipid-translocating ATPase [Fusarium beomiforme]|uniref:Phospholipid-translocating ATPase n=1 Tax=Fusarium beomiforme TaxID=44412 RepID=A0A9P5AS93_9HYPO|nr:phospholipid-translocating ATPase [Fusarium beomiforme]